MESVGMGTPGLPLLRRAVTEAGLTAAVAVAIGLRIYVSAQHDNRPAGLQAYAIGILMAALLPLRRRAPLAVLQASVALLIVYHATGNPGMSPVVPLAVPLYAAALAGHLRWAVSAAAAGTTAAVLFTVVQ